MITSSPSFCEQIVHGARSSWLTTFCNIYFDQNTGILEENYDDLDDMKAEVDEINNTEAQEPICEESYDDLDTVAEQAKFQLQNGMFLTEEFSLKFICFFHFHVFLRFHKQSKLSQQILSQADGSST